MPQNIATKNFCTFPKRLPWHCLLGFPKISARRFGGWNVAPEGGWRNSYSVVFGNHKQRWQWRIYQAKVSKMISSLYLFIFYIVMFPPFIKWQPFIKWLSNDMRSRRLNSSRQNDVTILVCTGSCSTFTEHFQQPKPVVLHKPAAGKKCSAQRKCGRHHDPMFVVPLAKAFDLGRALEKIVQHSYSPTLGQRLCVMVNQPRNLLTWRRKHRPCTACTADEIWWWLCSWRSCSFCWCW